MIRLVPHTHPALITVSDAVDLSDIEDIREVKNIAAEMLKLMRKHNGIGLAANQVGITKRFFVWKFGTVINPVIVRASEEKVRDNEGCLSFPGVLASVSRPARINVEYYETNGEKREKALSALQARVFQHELHHLDGINIINDSNVVIDPEGIYKGLTGKVLDKVA